MGPFIHPYLDPFEGVLGIILVCVAILLLGMFWGFAEKARKQIINIFKVAIDKVIIMLRK